MKSFVQCLKMYIILTVLTGIIYPAIIHVLSHAFMHPQASGSLLLSKGVVIGSKLIGQNFTLNQYFWGRPSATNYNPLPSGGSNLSLTSADLKSQLKQRLAIHQGADNRQVPVDLLFSSASGLDPHISLDAALFQVERVSKQRDFSFHDKQKLMEIIDSISEYSAYGLYGEKIINFVLLNSILDEEFK